MSIHWENKGATHCNGEVRISEENLSGLKILRTTCTLCKLNWWTPKK